MMDKKNQLMKAKKGILTERIEREVESGRQDQEMEDLEEDKVNTSEYKNQYKQNKLQERDLKKSNFSDESISENEQNYFEM